MCFLKLRNEIKDCLQVRKMNDHDLGILCAIRMRSQASLKEIDRSAPASKVEKGELLQEGPKRSPGWPGDL